MQLHYHVIYYHYWRAQCLQGSAVCWWTTRQQYGSEDLWSSLPYCWRTYVSTRAVGPSSSKPTKIPSIFWFVTWYRGRFGSYCRPRPLDCIWEQPMATACGSYKQIRSRQYHLQLHLLLYTKGQIKTFSNLIFWKLHFSWEMWKIIKFQYSFTIFFILFMKIFWLSQMWK